MDLSRFKSGSDIRGYALGDESNPLYMSDDMVMRCCAAFVNWLKTRTGKDKLYISVGHDSRLSAERRRQGTDLSRSERCGLLPLLDPRNVYDDG